ncbi:HNH endonuclease signature motif containing protein [uncultured Nocardioides sp.]|uniref:HNH endonuclease signature motif containing protein n=1 Tax=uncultured Nocardioides sp. TaxID=198441 RepID=UPI002635451D|nr:HNH endonuclease signature motif containing protein [uncultured Nocardioides sp.]
MDDASTDPHPQDPAALVAELRAVRRAEDAAAARVLALAVDWAAMHPAESLASGALARGVRGAEGAFRPAGPGSPFVTEFCVADLAATMGVSTDAGRSYLREAMELAHRLPRTYARVMAGELPAWRARRVAAATTGLPPAGADWVDRHVSHVAHKIGPAALERAVTDAVTRFDPEAADRAGCDETTDPRGVWVGLDAPTTTATVDGTGQVVVEVSATLDVADGIDLETALAQHAAQQLAFGSTQGLGVRRAHALGELARRRLGLDFEDDDTPDGEPRTARPTRRVEIVVHLSRAAVCAGGTGGNELVSVRHRGTGEVLTFAEQVRTWCNAAASVTVQPVIDLAGQVEIDGYAVPAHLERLVRLRDRHCVFPHCTRPATSCDLDHVRAYAAGGTTCAANLAPLCRFHHRLKTHGRWRYEVLDAGLFRWHDPWGQTYLVDTAPGGGTSREQVELADTG